MSHAEQAVLGALLLKPDALDEVGELRAEMFVSTAHRTLFSAIAGMAQRGDAVDVVTLAETLETAGSLDFVGGLTYIAMLAQDTPSAANIRHYAAALADKALDRALMAAAVDIDGIARGAGGIQDKLDQAQARLGSVAERRNTLQTVSITEALMQTLTEIEDRQSSGQPVGAKTGLADLDAALGGGLRDGALIVVAGRPSMGKTTLAMQIAERVADDKPVLFVSLEMPITELVTRSLSSTARVGASSLLTGHLSDDDWARITGATARLNTKKLHLLDASDFGVMQLRAYARQLKRKCGGLGLIVVDYLQLMRFEGDNETAGLGQISRGMKLLAKELSVPVVALSQLSRECEKRPNKRPIMSDLRSSGAIEQDADVVIMVYRDEVYSADSQYRGMAELLIRKNRAGPLKDVMTTFIGEYTRFESFAGMMPEPKPVSVKRRGWEDV